LLADSETDQLADWLANIPLERAVLFPCSDEWVAAIGNLPDDLQSRFPSSIPPKWALDQLIDKAKLERLGSELNLSRPRSWMLERPEDLPPDSEVPFDECFLKPLHSQQFHRRFGVKAFAVTSRADAIEKLGRCHDSGIPMILQQYVLGPASSHYFIDGFVDRNGRLCAMTARQRLRMYPLDFGDSSYMTSVELGSVEPVPEELTRLFAHLQYRGIFSAEYKRDERDGRLKLIEVNTRAWAYIEFALLCGVNVAEMEVADALAQPVSEIRYSQIGRSMKMFPKDLLAANAAVKAGNLSWLTVLKQWLSARSSLYRWDDPVPWVVQRFDDARLLARKLFRSNKSES
jgi:predicted ATP-grasp superfamily ATP-dependent carboligase